LRARAERAGILLDFDGSLAGIVDHPDDARPEEGTHEALVGLVGRYALVAILTGRPTEDIAGRLSVPGVVYEGLYGMRDVAPELVVAALPRVEEIAARVPQVWVENKGISIAVHYRQAQDPASARATLVAAMEPVVAGSGLSLVEGKMVLELLPADRPMKGGAAERLVGEHRLEGLLYAGDDIADLDAFAALDRLGGSGVLTVKVAVHGAETPADLIRRADVVVEGPAGLVSLLAELAE
jgi:trehalose 6-phosphate phosphatase